MMRLSRAPPIRNLRVFCAAGRLRSFKSAAQELYLTPSAVSHQMKELEETLGARLFERKPRALELTRAGAMLLDEVTPLLEALDRSLAQVARRGGRRALRLLLPPFFASELLIPRLAGFCAEHPDIDIQIDTRDARPATHPASADISVLIAAARPQGMRCLPLFALSLTAVCAPQHAAAVSRLGGAVFKEMALIVHKARPHAWVGWAEEVGLDTPEPRNVLELDSLHAVVRAAERGVGVALVPTVHCEDWFRCGALVRIFPVELPTADTYYLVTRPKDADKPHVRALSDWMAVQFIGPRPAAVSPAAGLRVAACS